MDESTTPVVLLAFANDRDAYLDMIVSERKAIAKALQEYDDRRYIKVVKEENTAVADIFDVCTHYANRIAIFHYGGHASGTRLQLEAAGQAEMANAVGLAQLLGQEKSLQLVFLNGCATEPQVQTLFASGVKAVIATAVPINDRIATDLAEQFYQALGQGATIQRAFQTAKARIVSKYDTPPEINEFRAIGSIVPKDAAAAPLVPWGLYVNPAAKGEDALNWTLPRAAEHQVIIRAAPAPANAGANVNVKLIETLFNAVARHSVEVGVMWEASKRTKQPNMRNVRNKILEIFPTPVGEQLRKLFADSTIGVERLRQLVLTYETIAQLFCFTVLSQLWNVKHENPSVSLTPEQVAAIERFVSLAPEEQQTFDYVALIEMVATVFHTHAVAPFIDEFATFGDSPDRDKFDRACHFMEEMRAELAQGRVAAEEISSFCVQAEEHLGTVLSHLAFLVRYKVATIKKIDIVKPRHKPAEYHHAYMLLDGPSTLTADDVLVDDVFTDSQSVILLKSADDAANYLSLSPFVIDENALTGDSNSKLFFYSHRDPGNGYSFRFVDNADDSLVITDERYPDIKQQFEDFTQTVRGL